jgi:hypothetical protein
MAFSSRRSATYVIPFALKLSSPLTAFDSAAEQPRLSRPTITSDLEPHLCL